MKDCNTLLFRHDVDRESKCLSAKSRHAASISGTQPKYLPFFRGPTQYQGTAGAHS